MRQTLSLLATVCSFAALVFTLASALNTGDGVQYYISALWFIIFTGKLSDIL